MTKQRAPLGDRRYAANRFPANRDGANPLMRAILAACARLDLDEDARRDLQADVIGKRSLRDMTTAELVKLRDHLNRGWQSPRRDNDRPHMGKIRALWWSLYWLGAIRRVDDDALTAFVKRQTGVESLRFLGHTDAPKVIEALKSWLEREGVNWWSTDQVAEIVATGIADFDHARADRHAVLGVLGQRLDRANLLSMFAVYEWIGAHVGRSLHRHWDYTPEELDAGIRALGKKLRRRLDAQDQPL